MLMMKSLAQEVAPQRIRVNSIAPGAIKTPINKEAWETEEARRELLRLMAASASRRTSAVQPSGSRRTNPITSSAPHSSWMEV
jgi:NAD(P)-dependent dehydrogenase (short-subunit alcohol dehydrogenase family)